VTPFLAAAASGAAIVMALAHALRADLTRARDGRILALLALFFVPSLAIWAGASNHMERAKTTDFCLSCHTMDAHGRSLYIDDKSFLPASHFQNNRVPRDRACYTCHTDYTMFGGLNSKWRGLRHVYVQYLGTIPKPEEIELYEPFNNRECLHCHAGARSFVDATPHNKKPELLGQVTRNEVSCMAGKCHDIVHDVESLPDVKFWSPDGPADASGKAN
jgi:cytochrome c-type protein NapC